MPNQSIPLSAIELGHRRREDYGDIESLARSIERYGLLHPPVVDDQHRLVAGARRLQAIASLGWDVVEVRSIGDLTVAELHEIELEENTRRKDLTSYEAAKSMLARATADALAVQDSVQQPATRGGHNRRPDSVRGLASVAGVSVSTIANTKEHVATAEAFPFMQKPDWKQYHVLQAKEAIEQLPEPERPKVAALIDKPATPPGHAIRMIRNVASMPAPKREEIYRLDQSPDVREQSLALTTAIELPPMPDPRLTRIERAIREIEAAIEPFPNDPETPVLLQVIETLRSVKSVIRKVAA